MYIDGFDQKTSYKITGPLFGTCAPIEHLQEINKMIFPKLDKIVVSIFVDTFIILTFLYRKHRILTHIRSIWRRNAHSGHNSASATQINAVYVSVIKKRSQISGNKHSKKTFHSSKLLLTSLTLENLIKV